MSTTNQTSDSQPSGNPETAGKPATGNSAKPTAKPTLSTKTSPLNAGWTKELLESAGFPPAIAEALAPAVTITVEADLRKKYTSARIGRFAKRAFGTLCK